MKLVNLTPHEINIYDGEKLLVTVPVSGQVARCAEERAGLGKLADTGISVSRATYGEVEGLPQPEPDTVYIVSALVLAAVGAERADVFAPGQAVRDAEGRVVGCVGLSAGSAYKA